MRSAPFPSIVKKYISCYPHLTTPRRGSFFYLATTHRSESLQKVVDYQEQRKLNAKNV